MEAEAGTSMSVGEIALARKTTFHPSVGFVNGIEMRGSSDGRLVENTREVIRRDVHLETGTDAIRMTSLSGSLGVQRPSTTPLSWLDLRKPRARKRRSKPLLQRQSLLVRINCFFYNTFVTSISALAPAKEEEEKQKNAKPAEERREPEVAKDKENIQPAEATKSDGFNIEDFLKQDIHNDFSQVFVSIIFK